MDWGGARIGRTKDSVKWTVAAAFGAFLVLFVMTAIAAPGAEAATTLQWQKSATTGPPGVIDSAMAFDPDAGNVLLYGGLSGDEQTVEQGTWTWDGSSWTQSTATDANAPGYLQQASMAYDPASDQLILFGGDTTNVYTGWVGETWQWENGTGWINATPSDPTKSPPKLAGAAMAYDPDSGDLVLYGGFNGSGVSDEMWVWDGSSWTQETPAGTPPPGLSFASMSYDGDSGQLMLYGGLLSESGPEYGGTWALSFDTGTDTYTWSQLTPTPPPPTLAAASMAYDPGNGLILYGGRADASTISNQTLQWTGGAAGTWSKLTATAPEGGLDAASIAFDATNHELVLYGGCTTAASNTHCGNGAGGSQDTWLGQTAPTVPQTPSASGAADHVTLSWTAPSNPGVAAGLTYEIFRGTASGGEDAQPIATGVTGTGYTDTAVTAGSTYYYTVVAQNSVGSSVPSTEVTAQAGTAAAITSAPTTSFQGGVRVSFTVTTSGDPQATVTETGTMPTGLTFTQNADGTATIAGTPVAGTAAGTYQLNLRAHNGVGSDATQSLKLVVTPATQQISFGSVPPAGLSVGQKFDATAKSSSNAAVTLSIDPRSTSNCVIDPNTGEVLGISAGTCRIDATEAGSDQYLLASADETIPVVAAPTIAARLSSRKPKSSSGWYRSPVKVTFSCNAGSGRLTGGCPSAVTLKRGGKETVRRTITSVTGATATASVTVKLDLTAPTVSIIVPKRHAYTSVPAAHCSAHDSLSGVASCKLTKRVRKTSRGETVTYTATATDRAGNVTVKHLTLRVGR